MKKQIFLTLLCSLLTAGFAACSDDPDGGNGGGNGGGNPSGGGEKALK